MQEKLRFCSHASLPRSTNQSGHSLPGRPTHIRPHTLSRYGMEERFAFRLLFLRKYFPNAWKTAVVIPILKPGKNPKLAESHRPISLLPILSKLAEKIIAARLNDYLENENILVPEQHGFRPRLSTTHQLLRVVEYIKDGIDRHQYTAAVFLDIQKAFDRVWHTGLLFKLIMYKIPPPTNSSPKILYQ
ncbi:probable RNA-directed DNA polymerase from transposon X-element [Trichonephila clavipes]|nr:probable RNA-directed DNA polymerase from transposon X-element [Trichonephila clavipes]